MPFLFITKAAYIRYFFFLLEMFLDLNSNHISHLRSYTPKKKSFLLCLVELHSMDIFEFSHERQRGQTAVTYKKKKKIKMGSDPKSS